MSKKSFFFDPSEIVKLKRSNQSIYGCNSCGLHRQCRSPKMEPFGQFQKRILIVAQAPGETEDEKGRALCGKAGKYLRDCLAELGINMDRDCLLTNVLQCRPPGNRVPTKKEMDCCFPRLEKQIREAKPHIILAFGTEAIQQVLDPPSSLDSYPGIMRGRAIPSCKWNAWVIPTWHPSFINRSGGRNSNEHSFFMDDLWLINEYLDKEVEWPLNEESGNILITEFDKAIDLLDSLTNIESPVAFDYETNKLDVFESEAKLLTASFCDDLNWGYCIPFEHPESPWSKSELKELYSKLKLFLQSSTPKVIQNHGFEDVWSQGLLNTPVNNVIQDTMVTTHILDCRQKVTGLDFQTFVLADSRYWVGIDKENISSTPLPLLARYNILDSRYTLYLYMHHEDKLKIGNYTEANELFTSALPLFSDMTVDGIKIDEEQLASLEKEYKQETESLQKEFNKSKLVLAFKKKHGHLPDMDGRNDLLELFYTIGKVKLATTKKGNPCLDGDKLELIASSESSAKDVAKLIVRWRTAQKMLTTYIANIKKLVQNGYIHPGYHLHTARSYRSSGSKPNPQNQPIRNEDSVRIRKVFVPRNDFFLEVDFSGNEVRHMAMYCKDKTLIKFLQENYDFHREWAARIYGEPIDQITEEKRFYTKNNFVFPSFYGAIPKSIQGYLRNRARLEISVEKITEIQDDLFFKMPDIRTWQSKEIDFYRKNGYVEMFTGFRRYGPLDTTMITNTAVQGTAFHTLLAGLVEARDLFRERKLKSKIIVQVHDSALVDVVAKEESSVVDTITNCLTKKRWDWMGEVPMEIGWKKGPNWCDVKGVSYV